MLQLGYYTEWVEEFNFKVSLFNEHRIAIIIKLFINTDKPDKALQS